MNYVGIDYSLTCPCVCIGRDNIYENSFFYYLTTNKKLIGQAINIFGDYHVEHKCEQERYENIASWVLGILSPMDKKDTAILIEDYSFGSKGRVFHIAENCGLLKYLLYKENYTFYTVPPTVIKKYATGKGNSDKSAMYESFRDLTKVRFLPELKGKVISPISDIVDAFYLKNYLRECIINDTVNQLFKDNKHVGSKI